MELQEAWSALQQRGVAVFAISYDSVETLAAFADKRGITFPLLSDEGSRTIRALGLLNEHVAEQHAFYGVQMRDEHIGVAYPGTFVLDKDGVITAKHFEQSYRVRPTARIFEEYALGTSSAAPPDDAARSSAGDIAIRAWTDSPTYRPYQQVRLHVEIALPADTHIFAAPVPEPYTPLSVQVEPVEGLTAHESVMPPTEPFTVEGLDEHFFVYEGSIRATIPLQLTKNLGETTLALRVAYQACTSTVCFAPASQRVEVPLHGLELIRD